MQTFVDKVNAAIDRITGTFTRNGKTLTITSDDGTPINIDLSASPNVVLSGLAITQDGANQRLFNVTAGTVRIDENEVAITAGSSSAGNGDPINPRIDALVVTDSDTIKVVAGSPAAAPIPPTIPSNELIIAYIYVEANATDVAENVYYLPLFDSAFDGVYKKGGVTVEYIGGVLQPVTPEKADQSETDAGTNDTKFITPAKFAASTTRTATQGEVDAGTNTTQYITPATLTNWAGLPTGELLTTTVTTGAISTDQNDYNIAGFGPSVYLRFNATANIDLTGFLASSFSDRNVFGFSNIGTGDIRVKNNSAFSAANNRILTNGNFIIQPNHGCLFVRDGGSNKFRVFVHRT